jgi:hypothetical protein
LWNRQGGRRRQHPCQRSVPVGSQSASTRRCSVPGERLAQGWRSDTRGSKFGQEGLAVFNRAAAVPAGHPFRKVFSLRIGPAAAAAMRTS